MPLDKAGLKAAIVLAFTESASDNDGDKTPQQAIDEIATKLSDAIDTYVRTAKVSTQVSVQVTTAGSATAQSGGGTGTGEGTLS